MTNRKQQKYMITITVILLMRLIIYMPQFPAIADYISFQYLLSYRFGFIGRGFIGTIVQLFSEELSKNILWCIAFAGELLLTGLYLCFCSYCLKNCKNKIRKDIFILISLYTLSPYSIAFTYAIHNFGRFDLYLIAIALLQGILLAQKKFSVVIGILTVTLSIVGMLIHPIYIFLYSPVSQSLLAYHLVRGKRKKETGIFLLFNSIGMAALFAWFHFANQAPAGYTPDSMFQALQSMTDVNIMNSRQFVNDWYFNSAQGLLNNTVKPFKSQLITILLTLFYSWPIILFYFYIFIHAGKSDRTRKTHIYWLMPFFCLTSLPCFILEIDYGRWIAGVFICLFIMTMALILLEDEWMIDGVRRVKIYLFRHFEFIPFLGGYFVLLGIARDIVSTDISSYTYHQTEVLIHLFKNILTKLLG